VSDELWEASQPLWPVEPPKPPGGRPRVPDRAALTGRRFVLRRGIPWELRPQARGCGSGGTCWRRLRDWQQGGVWERVPRPRRERVGRAARRDWSRARLDSRLVPANRGAQVPAPIRRTAGGRARSPTG